MKTPLPRYTGNKNIPGLLHTIFNNIPAVQKILEPFCGSAIISYKAPELVHTIMNDLDPTVVFAHVAAAKKNSTVTAGNGIELIRNHCKAGKEMFIYCDPPYLLSSRTSGKELYSIEFTVYDHIQLLTAVWALDAYCMISHPRNRLYDEFLHGWRRVDQLVNYNGTTTIESIYMNYAVPANLMTYEYLGADCWDRQRIKRMKENFISKLHRLDPQSRNMLMAAATEEFCCTTR